MLRVLAGICGVLVLAACGHEAPVPQPTAAAQAPVPATLSGPQRHVVALGDSLFAGYGLKPGESYPAQLETALRARGINVRIANAGVSGDTSADGLQRLAFTLNSQAASPDLALISLGGNDMLRGIAPAETRANLDAILTELGRRKVPVLMMGMLAAPNMGADYRAEFDAIYPALAKKHHAALVPFFLQPVLDRPNLVQADHVHPTRAGVAMIVAANADAVRAALER